ncbi:MAG: hypothetical protein M1833_006627 [Piccolia ochrophora]|nr:MAG: hypothetical protein M1833_006627 [Piccolia ochrophora]
MDAKPIPKFSASEEHSLKAFWKKDSKDNAIACKPAEEAVVTAEDFKVKIKKRLTKHQWGYLEDQPDAESLRSLMQKSLDDASKAMERHSQDNTCMARFGRKTSDTAYTTNGFLSAYAGVVQTMTQATSQVDYGNVAYQTMTLFLVVAANKIAREEKIDETFRTLQSEFSRMKILDEIHSTEKMKSFIAQAYRLGIDFLREVTFYYSGSRLRRLWENIVDPPQLTLDKNVADITSNMAEIDKEKSILDSKRLYEVQAGIQEVNLKVESKRNKKTTKTLQQIHLQKEQQLLAELKGMLMPAVHDIHQALERYRSNLRDTFGDGRDLRSFSETSMHTIRQRQAYKEWISSSSRKPCVLLLQGETEGTTHYNWLSPAAFRIAEECRDQGSAVAFHCCQRADSMTPGDSRPVVLSSILYQLLKARPIVLRDLALYKILETSIKSSKFDKAIEDLMKAVGDVVLVLDRVERIKGEVEEFLDPLLRSISAMTQVSRIKVLMTASPYAQLESSVVDSLKGTMGGSRYFKVLKLNQTDVDWDFE